VPRLRNASTAPDASTSNVSSATVRRRGRTYGRHVLARTLDAYDRWVSAARRGSAADAVSVTARAAATA